MRNSLIALSSIALLVSCSSGTRTTQASPSPAQVPAPTPTAPVAAEMRRDSAARPGATGTGATSLPNADPFPSTYRPIASRPTVIRNVTILTAAGPTIRNGAVLLTNAKISQVGATVNAPSDAIVVDGTGKYVTPGIIDTHSHIGGGAAPGDQGAQTDDINEATNPVTANVWVEHSVWPQDPQFPRSLAGGVTTIQVLPGAANLIGARSVVLKVAPTKWRRWSTSPTNSATRSAHFTTAWKHIRSRTSSRARESRRPYGRTGVRSSSRPRTRCARTWRCWITPGCGRSSIPTTRLASSG